MQYNQHLLNLKQIDFKRKENRAEFHIKQRDNYIFHLKEQLLLRDKILKEKLGISFTNFMPSNGGNPGRYLMSLILCSGVWRGDPEHVGHR